MTLLLFLALGAALGALALAMDRHHRAAFPRRGRAPSGGARRGLRAAGWTLLLLSLTLAASDATGLLAVCWCLFAAAHGIALAAGIAYAPRAVPAWTGLCLAAATATGLVALLQR